MSSIKSRVTISIIIPTRNREVFLGKCLQRLVGQVGKKDEVLVVDNGSQDDTKEIILGFQDELPIKYFFEPRRGPSFARNLGAKKAKGDVLVFLDDDCLVSPTWFEEVKNLSQSTNCAVQGKTIHQFSQKNIFVDLFHFYYSLTRKIHKEKEEKDNYLRVIDYLLTGDVLVKKSFVEKIGYWFDEELFPFVGEQEDLSIRLQRAGIKIYGTSKMRVNHIKEKKGMLKNLISLIYKSFFYGRTEGILGVKYLPSKKIKRLFREEIKQIKEKEKKRKKHLFITELKSLLRDKKISYKLTFLILVAIRELFFFLGRVYSIINYKITTQLPVFNRTYLERVIS